MNILLKFDYESYVAYIPNGYIKDIRILQKDFFDWLYSQEENITNLGCVMGVSYNVQDFLQFINEVILRDCSEVAYLLLNNSVKKIHGKISF